MLFDKLIRRYFLSYRRRVFKALSDNIIITGEPTIIQPVLYKGKGKIIIGDNVNLGYDPSPLLYTGYLHIESRSINSVIEIGNNVYINNNAVICCDKTFIKINTNVLIGANVEIIDSDFHNLDPSKRLGSDYECSPVEICENAFIGSNSKILKGVTIGKNSVIANASVVTKSVPDNVIAGGNPAKILKSLIDKDSFL